MDRFAETILLYAQGRDAEVEHYPGQYAKRLALELKQTIPIDAPAWWWRKAAGLRMVWSQRKDLSAFGVEMETWFHESHLHGGSYLDAIAQRGLIWHDGIGGKPICANCATRLRWYRTNRRCCRCPMCSGGWKSYVPPWSGYETTVSYDAALSPENDFMPEPAE